MNECIITDLHVYTGTIIVYMNLYRTYTALSLTILYDN